MAQTSTTTSRKVPPGPSTMQVQRELEGAVVPAAGTTTLTDRTPMPVVGVSSDREAAEAVEVGAVATPATTTPPTPTTAAPEGAVAVAVVVVEKMPRESTVGSLYAATRWAFLPSATVTSLKHFSSQFDYYSINPPFLVG